MNATRPVLELENLAFRYPNGHRVFQDVYLQLNPGQRLALCGLNGAGKSTLLLVLAGLLPGAEGLLRVCGQVQARDSADHPIALLLQNPDHMLFAPTLRQDLDLSAKLFPGRAMEMQERIQSLVQKLSLENCLDLSPDRLSVGQRKRAALAAVLLLQPKILLLDEPTAGLDPRGRLELKSLLDSMRSEGTSLMVASHDLPFVADWADTVVLLHQGRLLGPFTREVFFGTNGAHQLLYGPESGSVGAGSEVDLI